MFNLLISDESESRLAVLQRVKDILRRRLLNSDEGDPEDSLDGLEDCLDKLGIKIPTELETEESTKEMLSDSSGSDPADFFREGRGGGPRPPLGLEQEEDEPPLHNLLVKIRQDSNLKHKRQMLREHGLHPQERLDKQWKEFRRWRRKRKRRRKLRRRVLGDVLKELGLGRKNGTIPIF